MSEENNQNPEASLVQDAPSHESGEIIEVEWQELEELIRIRSELLNLDAHLSSLLLEHEKIKRELLFRSDNLRSTMYDHGAQIRKSKNIDPSLVYELKLPESEGGKGYFVRKDAETDQ